MTDSLPRRVGHSRRQTNRQVFAVPLLLGVLSSVGLVSALVGDGVWNGLSWLLLGIPVSLFFYFLLRPRHSERQPVETKGLWS